MHEIEGHCKECSSIRLAQDAYNTSAFAFYSSLNYDYKDMICILKGELKLVPPSLNGKIANDAAGCQKM